MGNYMLILNSQFPERKGGLAIRPSLEQVAYFFMNFWVRDEEFFPDSHREPICFLDKRIYVHPKLQCFCILSERKNVGTSS